MKNYFDPTELLKNIDLAAGLEARPFDLNSSAHANAVERVCELYQALKRDQPNAPAPYQPGGEWLDYIEEKKSLYAPLLSGQADQVSEILGNFWRNEFGAIVKEYAKYEQLKNEESEYLERFLFNVTKNYMIWKDIFRDSEEKLAVPNVGNPWGVVLDGNFIVPKATRFHAHSSMISELLSDVPQAVVGEIGAGYGGVAYYLLRDKENLTYIDFDLPESLVIAAYYLLACFPEKKIFLYGEGEIPSQDSLSDYQAVLLPNYALANFPSESIDLFLNSFSLSEMPRETHEEYLQKIASVTKRYFLHNNMDRKGVVNRGFERIPASEYAIDPKAFKCLYKKFDLFHGQLGDYREFLYEKR